MYLVVVLVTMFAAPVASIALDLRFGDPLVALVGKWFVFWTVGVRLALAGGRQIMQPGFTANEIFGIADRKAWLIVRELGLANLAVAVVALASLVKPAFVAPAAVIGAIFYGGAGVQHFVAGGRSQKETVALASDLFAFVALAGYAVWALSV